MSVVSNPRCKVAYLVSEYPKVSHTFIQREIEGVRRAGVEVETFSIREPAPADVRGEDEQSEYQATTYIFKQLKSPLKVIKAHLASLRRNPKRYFGALRWAITKRPAGLKAFIYHIAYFVEAGILAQELVSRDHKHLHVHFANAGCTVALLAGKISGIPFSFTMHGPTEFFDVDKFKLGEKVAGANFVSCISHFCKSQLMLFSDKSHWNKFEIIRCGIVPELYQSAEAKDPGRLLFVGRMSGVKGVPLVLQAVAKARSRIPQLRLTLVGDGEERTELEAQAKELGVADIVAFLGYQTQAEVAEHMKSAEVLTLPSFAEGLPVVLMEALASATPVVTTRIAGVGELVVDNVNGLLTNAGSLDDLVEALVTLFEDPEKRQKMGKSGQLKVAQDFNIALETKKLAQIFEQKQGQA